MDIIFERICTRPSAQRVLPHGITACFTSRLYTYVATIVVLCCAVAFNVQKMSLIPAFRRPKEGKARVSMVFARMREE